MTRYLDACDGLCWSAWDHTNSVAGAAKLLAGRTIFSTP
jgi:hypothetical protein